MPDSTAFGIAAVVAFVYAWPLWARVLLVVVWAVAVVGEWAASDA